MVDNLVKSYYNRFLTNNYNFCNWLRFLVIFFIVLPSGILHSHRISSLNSLCQISKHVAYSVNTCQILPLPDAKYLYTYKKWLRTNLFVSISYLTCLRPNLINQAFNLELLALHGDIEINPGPSGKLFIGTYNISGCKNYSKLRRIMAWIYSKKKTDRFIFSLQETYLTNNDVCKVENLWREGLVIAPSTGRARGVITVFSTSLFENLVYSYGSPDGRLTIVIGEYNSSIDMFVSIYSPNSGKNAEFYTSFFAKVDAISNKYKVDNIFISGDFNLLLAEAVGNRTQTSYEKKLCKIIINEMSNLGLSCINDLNKHTWNRSDKFSTLDYIFIPKHMADSNPNVSVIFGVDKSDHGVVQANISFELDKGRGLFKPNLAFLECVESRTLFEADLFILMNEVNSEWDPHTKLEYAKVMIRTKAAEYSLKHNKRTESRHDSIIIEMNKLQALKNSVVSNPMHHLHKYIKVDHIDSDLFSLNLELDKVLNDKTKILSNKSRLKWLEYGEKSNKYFLNLNKSFQNSAYFKSFLINGAEVFDSDTKIKVVYDFYSDLYAYHGNDNSSKFLDKINVNSFSNNANSILNQPLTKSELSSILKKSGDTASGPDGIGYKLLKTCWSFYGDILINSWNYALQTGKMAQSHRESVICLLQKKGKDRRFVGNLRPISLSNCDIKVITKAITKRCNSILNDVLNPHQTAYIPGRIVHDNLRSIDIVKDMCVKHNIEGYLVSLDAKKAFDSVDHNFIDAVLCKFNCSNEFRIIVRVLYNDLSSRVLVNGHISDSYPICRSVKQGDALSCVLFIMCMETIINAINQNSSIESIKFGDLVAPKVLAFADDIAVMVSNKDSIAGVIREYNSFSRVSGLYLNVDKTEIMNLKHNKANESVNIGESDNTTTIMFTNNVTICGKYFSLDGNTEHKVNVLEKIDKLQNALKQWSKRSLSIFGRNLILKTFGLSQVIYSMQNSVFTENDINAIEKICYNFLWNKKADKSKAYERISRRKLKMDFNSGGINAPDIYSIYKSLVVRQILRSTTQSCQHSINSLQRGLAGWNPDAIFQNLRGSFSNSYVTLASQFFGTLGELIVNEILSSGNDSKLLKTYYNLISTENPIIICKFLAPNSLTLNYTKMVTKLFGFSHLGQLINEYKFPSSDRFRSTIQFIIKSVKLFEILANRKTLSYGLTIYDNFIIATNKIVSADKLTTKALRLRFFNGCDIPVLRPEYNCVKKITHPKEREVIFFQLHNVIITNTKLYEMKFTSSPLCEQCNTDQTSDHIFNHCYNATQASKALNDFSEKLADNHHIKLNVESLIKRLLYLNRNSKISVEIFNIAIANRIKDFRQLQIDKIKRKELTVINKITLL